MHQNSRIRSAVQRPCVTWLPNRPLARKHRGACTTRLSLSDRARHTNRQPQSCTYERGKGVHHQAGAHHDQQISLRVEA